MHETSFIETDEGTKKFSIVSANSAGHGGTTIMHNGRDLYQVSL